MRRYSTSCTVGLCKPALLTLTVLMCAVSCSSNDILENETTDTNFIINNIEHIVYHEFGHAIIDQYKLPVIGQEEDAADTFATLHMIKTHKKQAADKLWDVSEAMVIMHDQSEADGEQAFYDEHDLDIQRAYRIICHAYGIDPENNINAADWIELPEERRETCEGDAAIAQDSWETILKDTSPRKGDKSASIAVRLEPSKKYAAEAALLQSSEVLAQIGKLMSQHFAWPYKTTLIAKECGEANAFYDIDNHSVELCYELISDLYDIEKERQ